MRIIMALASLVLTLELFAQLPFANCVGKRIQVTLFEQSADVYKGESGTGAGVVWYKGQVTEFYNSNILMNDDPDGYPHVTVNALQLDTFISDEDPSYESLWYRGERHKVKCYFMPF